MTIFRRLNQGGLGGNHSTWWIIKTMVDAGWTVPFSGSGNGGIYTTGNVFDMAQTPKQNSLKDPNNQGVGSEPWGWGACWVVLEDPDGNRQYAIRRSATDSDSSDDDWYFGYSPGGLYGVGQTAGIDWDETTLPAATDSANLRGTPTVPSSCFASGGTSTLLQVAADDSPSPNGEYGVIALDFIGTNNNYCSFMIDDLRNASVGHPHALTNWLQTNDNPYSLSVISGTGTNDPPGIVQDYGGGAQRYQGNCPYCYYRYGGATLMPGNGGVGVDGKERALPVAVGFVGTEDYVGTSRWCRYPSVTRGYPNTGNSETLLFVTEMLIVDLLDGVTTPASI